MKETYLEEEWRSLPGLPRYSVSDFGRIYDHRFEKLLRISQDRKGYCRVDIYIYGVRTRSSLHRLIAFAFLGTDTEFLEVNHDDGDKTYNHISNLNLMTRSENMKHAYANGLSDIPYHGIPIFCVEKNKEYKSTRAAARDLDIPCHKSISRILDDPNKTTHGYHFKSKEVVL